METRNNRQNHRSSICMAWKMVALVSIVYIQVLWCCDVILYADQDSKMDLIRRIRLLQEQYMIRVPLHFKANTKVRTVSELNYEIDEEISQTYEYWGDGDKYRANVEYQSQEPHAMALAYNGQMLQEYNTNVNTRVMILRKEDFSDIPKVNDAPLLIPVIFMSPGYDGTCKRLRFKDLLHASLWDKLLQEVELIDPGPDYEMAFECPGNGTNGKLPGMDIFRVYFGKEPDHMPTKIVGYNKDYNGKVLTITWTIGGYECVEHNGKKTYWPKAISSEPIYDGKSGGTDETIIELIEYGIYVPDEKFHIDYTDADVIVDYDSGAVIRSEGIFYPTNPVDQVIRDKLAISDKSYNEDFKNNEESIPVDSIQSIATITGDDRVKVDGQGNRYVDRQIYPLHWISWAAITLIVGVVITWQVKKRITRHVRAD